METIEIKCTAEEKADLISKANLIIGKIENLRCTDKTPILAEDLLSKMAMLNLEKNIDMFLNGMNLK